MTESNNASRLDELAYELEKAKDSEAAARNHRLHIEQLLSELVGVKDEGSYTTRGSYYKVTTTTGFTRTLDAKKWEEIKHRVLPAVASKVIRTRLEIDTRQLKSLQGLDPAAYHIVAEAVTTKPKKVAVTFKRLEVE